MRTKYRLRVEFDNGNVWVFGCYSENILEAIEVTEIYCKREFEVAIKQIIVYTDSKMVMRIDY